MSSKPPSRRLELNQPVSCTDGELGTLQDVVIDPSVRRVTHIVVQPHNASDRARLLPIELVSAADGALRLSCTLEEVWRLPAVHEQALLRLGRLPPQDPDWDVGVQDFYALPYTAGAFVDYQPNPDPDMVMNYDRVPKGEIEIRRASSVTTADGHHVGRVDGFLADGGDITHLVLERGHFWNRREVTIPIGAVAEVRTDEVTLTLPRRQLRRLRSVPVRRR